MSSESKEVDANLANAAPEVEDAVKADEQGDSGAEGESEVEDATAGASATAPKKKKKRSKKKAKKETDEAAADTAVAESSNSKPKTLPKHIPKEMLNTLLELNPALRNELASLDPAKATELLKNMDVSDLMTGLAVGGKNQRDMASYKFWQTQPVPRFDDKVDKGKTVVEGPIKTIDPEQVSKEPDALLEGFEWVTLNLDDEVELREVYELLSGHYVEDDNAMFRFNYSTSFLNWALKSPGWKKEWHVGVRATKSRKLLATICGVPTDLRVRDKVLKVSEINFLCIHKKLRSKRLAPILIKEVTRRCYLQNIYQAIYTAGIILPKPVSSCRYYHRALDWLKLYEIGFSPLPSNSTKARQITRNHLPSTTATPGLRPMEEKDIDAVMDLLARYLKRFEMAPEFTREEIDHWLLHRQNPGAEQVVWAYVVEDPTSGKITDLVSFYSLNSSVISHPKHNIVRAAYLFYYATEAAFEPEEKGLKDRLQLLMNDALILAKRANFDVFNALTLQDNPLFLDQLKFGAGDGQLHYYLFNYRAAPIAGGVNEKNLPDEKQMGGVGVVML